MAIEDLRDAVDALSETDRIAEAIAEKMGEKQVARMSTGTYTLTKWQTWTAIGALLLTATSLIVTTVLHTVIL